VKRGRSIDGRWRPKAPAAQGKRPAGRRKHTAFHRASGIAVEIVPGRCLLFPDRMCGTSGKKWELTMKRKFRCIVMAGTIALVSGVSAANPPDRHIILINHSSQEITGFYASEISHTNWEENILSRGVGPGEERRINVDDGTPACLYDFKAVMEDGNSVVHKKVNVCTVDSWTIND
jgi:hypothetical protein